MIKEAIKALQNGQIILIFDAEGREEETDMVAAAELINPKHIYKMRSEAGGLICVAIHPKIADAFGLPFLTEVLAYAQNKFSSLSTLTPNDIPYDEKSAFSLTVNHRKTFTGITDNDRALTIKEIGKLGKKALMNGYQPDEFGKNFRSPGHVHLLRAADNLIFKRRGHTELSIALAEMAGLTPAVVICEMLDGETGASLKKEQAKAYAAKNNLIFIEGKNVVDTYIRFNQL
ncbi:MAG: 3,4-dihydroxy-2-butanone-4-phosphate synthase [Euryarchaeota archaeon]|nr:3,4-dihydroxy-2-butanone-4-phosphate synthase [Euryarchaeota archaeon]